MRIIGIDLKEGHELVIKTLNPGWYPFGDYEQPKSKYDFPWTDTIEKEAVLSKLYKDAAVRPFSENFNISISCIVGKNGSGKTTLLELMFRIINNFACYVFEKCDNSNLPSRRNMSHAKGFHAILYFETDGNFGMIEYCYENIYFMYNSKSRESKVESPEEFKKYIAKSDLKHILNGFFFTICSNYSLYSFNEHDYDSQRISMPYGIYDIDGTWLRGLLNKNNVDYQFPLAITPYRDEHGNINIHEEKELSKQRLSVLALILASNNRKFLDAYSPSYMEYRYDETSKGKFEEKFHEICEKHIHNNDGNCHGILLKELQNAWERKIASEMTNIAPKEVKDSIIMYLAYKTLEICVNYRSYGVVIKDGVLKTEEQEIERKDSSSGEGGQGEQVNNKYMPECNNTTVFDTVVKNIVEDHSNITIEIDQMLTFLNAKILKANYAPKGSDLYPTSVKIKNASEYIAKGLDYYNKNLKEEGKKLSSFNNYDDVFKLLPPSIFEWELYYSPKGQPKDKSLNKGISINSFSSGEKHLLQSLSYVISHIKNIENIVTDKYSNRYHHINVVLDEAELYYHPDFQRTMLAKTIELLSTINIDQRKIRSINFIVATHSPFVLSDVPHNRILYLEDGERKEKEFKTFSANIHELLYNHFYIRKPMGEVAYKVQHKIISFFNNRNKEQYNENEKKAFINAIPFYKEIIDYIGEPYLKHVLKNMIATIEKEQFENGKDFVTPDEIQKAIQEHKYAIEKLEDEMTKLKNKM